MLNDKQPVLEIENINHAFGKLFVLEEISFKVNQADIVCLLGPSGSGKSTLLNIIAGLFAPTTGRIKINGIDQSGIPTYKRDLGYVFQNPNTLFPHLNVFDNIAFPFKKGNKATKNQKWKDLVHDILYKVDLQAFQNNSISILSGGQMQRVALARALVYKPSLLLLDEPLGSLDNVLKDNMLDLLLNLHEDFKTTFIYVTHDEREALRIATHVAVLADRKLCQFDQINQVSNKPASTRVAQIMSSWNILEAQFDKMSEKTFKLSNDVSIPIETDLIAGKTSIKIGIPFAKTNFQLRKAESDKNIVNVPVTIKKVTQWYNGHRLFCSHNGIRFIAYSNDSRYKEGEQGFINFNKEDCHVFEE